jgi:hypothetical protein
MDPYLEAPDIWPDFHDRFAGQISGELNSSLPAPYYARLEMRPEVGIVEEGATTRRIVPDVAVVRRPPSQSDGGGVAIVDKPRTTISQSVEVTLRSETIRHAFVEIRDPTRGHQLVTLLEIVSPSNKREGVDRKAYLQKQREVLDSEASLIELDLLRTGERLLPDPQLQNVVAQFDPRVDYLVLVNRAWRRASGETAYQIFPILLAQTLPCISVPLRQGQEEVLLDLQFVFNHAYDSGPYRRGAVDYSRPPVPPLAEDQVSWAEEKLRNAGRIPPSAGS